MYVMDECEIVAPDFDNDGENLDYAGRFRRGLLTNAITGWTETRTTGYWHGRRETGTTFTIYLCHSKAAHWTNLLQTVARWAMPGQEAIQVTCKGRVELWEA